jgi:hypothetical protein
MNFRTEFVIKQEFPQINYNSKIMFFGSCFAENIGEIIKNNYFDIDINPFGIIYNPLSIVENINILTNGKLFVDKDLQYSNKLWFSYNHHGSFSNVDKNVCLNKINSRILESSGNLKNADIIFITFGTSWVYKLLETNKIVSNCHKNIEKLFERFRLTIYEIVNSYIKIISEIEKINKKANFVFTVSPIRHWKDGANGNQLSKSILLLAIDEIVNKSQKAFYFPSYELIMDDLRDYRFYKEDMIHINDIAVQYIWERFKAVFFTEETTKINNLVEKIVKALNHKPFNTNNPEYEMFIDNNIANIEDLERIYKINLHSLKHSFEKKRRT